MSINLSPPHNILHKIYDGSLSGRLDFIYHRKKRTFFFSKTFEMRICFPFFHIYFSSYLFYLWWNLSFFYSPIEEYIWILNCPICIWEKLKFTSDIGAAGWGYEFQIWVIDIKSYYFNNKRKSIGNFREKGFRNSKFEHLNI